MTKEFFIKKRLNGFNQFWTLQVYRTIHRRLDEQQTQKPCPAVLIVSRARRTRGSILSILSTKKLINCRTCVLKASSVAWSAILVKTIGFLIGTPRDPTLLKRHLRWHRPIPSLHRKKIPLFFERDTVVVLKT